MTFPSNWEPQYPQALLTVASELMHLRSQYIVSRALAEKFPDEASLETALSSQNVLQNIDQFAQLILEIRAEIAAGTANPAATLQMIQEYHGDALRAVDDLAKLLGVTGEDLLSVLVYTRTD
jgi:hypothetical protein